MKKVLGPVLTAALALLPGLLVLREETRGVRIYTVDMDVLEEVLSS